VSVTVDPADPQRWARTDYFGASLRAFRDLGLRRGYTLVYVDSTGVNAFFVRSDILACQGVAAPPMESLYRPPRYGPEGRGHPRETNASRLWFYLDEAGRVERKAPAEWR
jgi:hypothetical protein